MQFIRVVLFILIVIQMFVRAWWIKLRHRDKWEVKKKVSKQVHQSCRWVLKLMGVQVRVQGPKELLEKENFFIVSNHLSYYDIFTLSSIYPMTFVSSYEMLETPLVGSVVDMGASVFIERRNKKNIHNEIAELTQGLQQGLNIIVFPEAACGNGEQLMRFRRPLYQAAIDSHKPVLPVVLNYRRLDGEPISLKTRDQVFWYGDMTFIPHFINALKFKKLEIDVLFLPPIRDIDSIHLRNKDLARLTHEEIDRAYEGIQGVPRVSNVVWPEDHSRK